MKSDCTEQVRAAASGAGLLRGKVVVLTGASGTVGRPLAALLAREGARLALCARGAAGLKDAARLADGAFAAVCDVSDPRSVVRFAAAVRRRFGRVDVLINNAAERGRRALVTDTDAADFDRVLDVNLSGPFRMTRALLPAMPAGGLVLNVTSGAAVSPERGFAAYSVSKSGLEMLTRSLAGELAGRGIRVNALDPCVLRGRRVRLPEEMAAAFLYLCSAASGTSTGQVFALTEGAFAGGAPGSFRIFRR